MCNFFGLWGDSNNLPKSVYKESSILIISETVECIIIFLHSQLFYVVIGLLKFSWTSVLTPEGGVAQPEELLLGVVQAG